MARYTLHTIGHTPDGRNVTALTVHAHVHTHAFPHAYVPTHTVIAHGAIDEITLHDATDLAQRMLDARFTACATTDLAL